MDELIGRLAAKAGNDWSVAEKNIGIIPGFLRSEEAREKVQTSSEQIPGRDATITAANGGSVAHLMSNSLMAVAIKPRGGGRVGPGVGMMKVQTGARELLPVCRDEIGADQMGEIIAGTPGLIQFA